MTSVMTKVLRGMHSCWDPYTCATPAGNLHCEFDAADAAGPAVQRFSEVVIMTAAGQ